MEKKNIKYYTTNKLITLVMLISLHVNFTNGKASVTNEM